MNIEYIEIAAYLVVGVAVLAVDVILKPKFILSVAMWSAFFFSVIMYYYFSGPREEPIFPFILGSAFASIVFAMIGVGSNWLGRKIRQNAIDEAAAFDRKKRKPGQFY